MYRVSKKYKRIAINNILNEILVWDMQALSISLKHGLPEISPKPRKMPDIPTYCLESWIESVAPIAAL